ncbi:MAG: hypothetical protein RL634_1450, partial [Bacteroidota bacterium]
MSGYNAMLIIPRKDNDTAIKIRIIKLQILKNCCIRLFTAFNLKEKKMFNGKAH